MQIFIIIALVIAIIAVIFALQNLATITVSFLFWSIHGSLALVLLVTLLVGVLISLLASLPQLVRHRWTASSRKKKITALETELSMFKQKTEGAEKDIKRLEEQLASYSAQIEDSQPPSTN